MNANEIVIKEMQASADLRFWSFFEKALVSRVNLRMAILIVKFCRSTILHCFLDADA
jgi:hypothetical protein